MSDDIGTVRWFGETWNAPINDPRAEIPNPINVQCDDCGAWIGQADRGVRIVSGDGHVFYHLTCFFHTLGMEVVLETKGDEFYGYR